MASNIGMSRKRMSKDETELTPMQQRFVDEYLIDLNATQAAIRAGYSPKDADVQGPRLLGYVGIAAAIEEGKEERAHRTGITADRVLRELALLAFSDVTHYEVDADGKLLVSAGNPKSVRRAVSSIKRRTRTDKEGCVTHEVELKLWDKPGMLKLAGRHVGLFPDNDKQEVPQPTVIHVHTGVAPPPEIADEITGEPRP